MGGDGPSNLCTYHIMSAIMLQFSSGRQSPNVTQLVDEPEL